MLQTTEVGHLQKVRTLKTLLWVLKDKSLERNTALGTQKGNATTLLLMHHLKAETNKPPFFLALDFRDNAGTDRTPTERGQVSGRMGGRRRLGTPRKGSSGKELRCMYTNARSMGNKQEELEALLGIGGYDVVGITETWWDERQVWNVNIEGYHLFRKYRKGKRGGGVALYVREGIGCREIECSTDGDSVEAVWVKLRGFARERDLTVGVCYRPPGQLETLDDVLTGQILRLSQGKDTVIMGFQSSGYYLGDSLSGDSQVTSLPRSYRGRVFHTEGLRGDEGGNILDLVLTNREELIDEVQIRGALDASDHSILCFEIRGLGTCSRSSTRSWDFKRANFGQLKARLGIVSWDRLLEEEGRTCSNGAKLREPRFHLDARKHFLTVRIPRVWNGLPREVVEAPLVRVFKDRLDIHMVGMSQKEDKDAIFKKQLASVSRNDVVIMGDFSFPDICWKTISAKHSPSKRFLTCVADNFLQQKVEEGTKESAILDSILTNRDGLVDKITMGTLGESDHAILEFSIIKETKVNCSQTHTLDFKKADFHELRTMISKVPWQLLREKESKRGGKS
ncbi:Protein ROOT HAIR DEFECTIVE 3 [Varanus komodoensis]|nr:Protein ROOT HAIR DEFECTIVE 3 [Varanus komodoensis]